jgi:SAM-dependent methyltransferase
MTLPHALQPALKPLTAGQQALVAALAYAGQQSLPETGVLRRMDIEASGQSYFGMYCLDWAGALEDLAADGLLDLCGEGQAGATFTLTPSGLALARALSTDHPKYLYAYNEFFHRARRSPAHARFCERVYGRDLCQHGMLDMAQLDELVSLWKGQGVERALELGCGNGAVAGYLADQTGAHITGVDLAEEGIRWAQESAASRPGRLPFFEADMSAVEFPPGSFDAVLIVDAVYFVPDLPAFLRRVLSFLRPAGRLYVYYSAWVEDGNQRELLKVGGTHFARAIRELDLAFTNLDYSTSEREHWQRKRRLAEELKPEFEAEGNAWLQHRRWIEAEYHRPYVEAGNVSRYLYTVENRP